jgi:hypothetical protein
MNYSTFFTKISRLSGGVLDKKNLACLIPIISLVSAFFVYSFFYTEFTETNLSKTILKTGLTPAEVMIDAEADLTDTDIMVINNSAYAARSSWSVFAFLHVCICIAALIVGFYTIFAVTRQFSRWVPWVVSLLFLVYLASQLLFFNLIGNYSIVTQLLQRTIMSAEYSGFPQILNYVIFLNKFGFYVATLLSIAAGMTLLKTQTLEKRTIEQSGEHLRQQMGLLQITLYVGTIVLISAIFLWRFTLQWALVYIYPWDGPVHLSVAALTNSQILSSGIYYSVLLALSYVPVAAILHNRAFNLVEQKEPDKPVSQRSEWLKENGLSLSPMDLLPRIVAILGPLLAGSITELIKVVQSG